MQASFELDAAGLGAHFESKGLRDHPHLRVQEVVAGWSGEERFERADQALALAHLTYLLGISPLVDRPDDFPAHSLVGLAGDFGGWGGENTFMILLSSVGGPFVTEFSPSVLALLEPEGEARGFRSIQAMCVEILSDANRLVRAARSAAASR